MTLRTIILAAAILLLAASARADGPPRLGLPLDCRMGETCWIMNYFDAESGPVAHDYRCGPHTYHAHGGVDFAVRDRKEMDRGVPVLAVAAGTVVQARDGEKDGVWAAGGQKEVLAARRECGNRVVLDLGGWFADYCHMRSGSVAVKTGERVAAGQRLGLVGFSGMTDYPHVHLGLLRRNPDGTVGEAVDPFTGLAASAGCGHGGASAFAQAIPYQHSSLFAAGFADHAPSAAELRVDASSPASLPAAASTIIQWGAVFAIDAGTAVSMRLTSPSGAVLADDRTTAERALALAVFALPRRAPAGGWAPGSYRGEITVTPPGGPAQTRAATIELR